VNILFGLFYYNMHAKHITCWFCES